jgi:hypothetical protein
MLRLQATVRHGLDSLSGLPGISLVIASKIYRFCYPRVGAAIDRHASYFFNSLPIVGQGPSTHFTREWANGAHRGSRLAIYSAAGFAANSSEYVQTYLPTLAGLATALNMAGHQYQCAATGLMKTWTPADVEMASYYWWALNGAR